MFQPNLQPDMVFFYVVREKVYAPCFLKGPWPQSFTFLALVRSPQLFSEVNQLFKHLKVGHCPGRYVYRRVSKELSRSPETKKQIQRSRSPETSINPIVTSRCNIPMIGLLNGGLTSLFWWSILLYPACLIRDTSDFLMKPPRQSPHPMDIHKFGIC